MDPNAGPDVYGKSSHPPGFDPRTVQPLASHYTDYEGDLIWVSWDRVKLKRICSYISIVGSTNFPEV